MSSYQHTFRGAAGPYLTPVFAKDAGFRHVYACPAKAYFR